MHKVDELVALQTSTAQLLVSRSKMTYPCSFSSSGFKSESGYWIKVGRMDLAHMKGFSEITTLS